MVIFHSYVKLPEGILSNPTIKSMFKKQKKTCSSCLRNSEKTTSLLVFVGIALPCPAVQVSVSDLSPLIQDDPRWIPDGSDFQAFPIAEMRGKGFAAQTWQKRLRRDSGRN
jgi:hypothetical protein